MNNCFGKQLKIGILSLVTGGTIVAFCACPGAFVKAEGEPWMQEEYSGYESIGKLEERTPLLEHPEELGDSPIPASYDAREHGQVTSVKDQYQFNSCWAFSAIGALESGLLSQGYYQNVDLSETHLIRYSMSMVNDPLGGLNNDILTFEGKARMLQGGNVLDAYHTLTALKGAVDEEAAPLPYEDEDPGFTPSVEDAFSKDIVHLRSVYKINIKDTDGIKRAIMNYGAVTSAFYWKSGYNNQNNSYYSGENPRFGNHAVIIVGWDDNFSRTKFKNDPGMDGAWLVKNSWGTSFGDGGYLWISYAEKTMDSTSTVLLAEPANKYDYCYQYDGSIVDGLVGGTSKELIVANVFTAHGGSAKEVLKAVSVDLLSAETLYEVQVYKNLTDLSSPTSGTPMLSTPVKGITSYAGYYTIDMPENIVLEKGCTFSVVITLKSEKENIIILHEINGNGCGTKCEAHALPQQSLIYDPAYREWADFGKEYDSNLRIKAFTARNDSGEDDDPENPFADIKSTGDWQYSAARYVYDRKIMGGKGELSPGKVIFAPTTPINRAEFVRVLYNMEGAPAVTYSPKFQDVPDGKWFTGAVIWASDKGLVAGKGNNLFDVNGSATREELAVMFYHYAEYKGYDVSIKEGEGTNLNSFTDAKDVSSWSVKSLKWALSRGVMAGKKDRLDPHGKATRAECAAMIRNFFTAYPE